MIRRFLIYIRIPRRGGKVQGKIRSGGLCVFPRKTRQKFSQTHKFLPEIYLTLGRVYAIILNCVGLEPANFAMQGDISTRRLSCWKNCLAKPGGGPEADTPPVGCRSCRTGLSGKGCRPGTGGAAAGGLPCSGSACRDGVYHVTAGPGRPASPWGPPQPPSPAVKTVFPE